MNPYSSPQPEKSEYKPKPIRWDICLSNIGCLGSLFIFIVLMILKHYQHFQVWGNGIEWIGFGSVISIIAFCFIHWAAISYWVRLLIYKAKWNETNFYVVHGPQLWILWAVGALTISIWMLDAVGDLGLGNYILTPLVLTFVWICFLFICTWGMWKIFFAHRHRT